MINYSDGYIRDLKKKKAQYDRRQRRLFVKNISMTVLLVVGIALLMLILRWGGE